MNQPVVSNSIRETHMTVAHKRGRWSILTGPPILGIEPVMYHQCIKSTTEKPEQSLHPVAFTNRTNVGVDDKHSGWSFWIRVKPKWRCRECGKTPPDSIITTFTLLTYDETTKEMARVTQDYYNCKNVNWWDGQ